jgi:flagellar motor switch protein FliN
LRALSTVNLMSDSPANEAASTTESAAESSAPQSALDAQLAALPLYARGLLNISVPVHVALASQRTSIQEIIELGPGSIVKFDKMCDEPLDLMVGDRTLAQGEVVKVGDKFGLRIRSLST